MGKPKYALSLSRPWAWACASGLKPVENRNWGLPRKLRGEPVVLPLRIYIHAAKSWDKTAVDFILPLLSPEDQAEFMEAPDISMAIIGEADIVAQVKKGQTDFALPSDLQHYLESPWFFGKHGFILANTKLYDTPISCKGKLGFFIPGVAIP